MSTPPRAQFTDDEFQTLRDELEHLGTSSVRLGRMETAWVAASQERDFDRRVQGELGLSRAELDAMKGDLLAAARARRKDGEGRLPAADADADADGGAGGKESGAGMQLFAPSTARSFGVADADVIDSDRGVGERLQWLVFGDATEEKLKVVLLYLPAVLMSFVTATFFTVSLSLRAPATAAAAYTRCCGSSALTLVIHVCVLRCAVCP